MVEDYLRKVQSSAEVALVQTGAVTRCERHKDVLLYNADYKDEHVPFNLASIWLKQEGVLFSHWDLREAIKGMLDGAAKDGCPECGPPKDS